MEVCAYTRLVERDRALRAAKSIAQRLEDYWLSLRLSKLDIPGLHLLRDKPVSASVSSCETLSEALELYLRLKGVGRIRSFIEGLRGMFSQL